MSANAETEKRWQIRGQSASGKKLAFPVSGFDYADAKKKAKAKLSPGDRIDDIVLIEKRKARWT